ncbi:MAG: ABC transporter permease [Bacteroidales bacterium]|jgi:putative ABC transport system permease protein|nr:ABC transporter permease [Bacteroidales bacterium]
MFKSYVLIALRGLRKQKRASLINIAGLAIGFASFIFIFLYIQSELSFDKHWPDSEKIYRVSESVDFGDRYTNFAVSPFPLAPSFQSYFPEIENTTRIAFGRTRLVKHNEYKFMIDNIHYADDNFFSFFLHKFLEGSAVSALNGPDKIAISEEVKEKFFPGEEAIGKTLYIDTTAYMVSGVYACNQEESHLTPNILIPVSSFSQSMLDAYNRDWTLLFGYTYLKFQDKESIQSFKNKLPGWIEQTIKPWREQHELTLSLDFKLQALSSIHFQTDYDYDISSNTDKRYIYIFSFVCVFILLIASINYINLATARAIQRSKEVGIRKLVGAKRKQLIIQFLGESVLTATFALIVGCLIVELLLPSFNELTGKAIDLYSMLAHAKGRFQLLLILGTGIGIGLISGIFPAFVMSGYDPVSMIKQKFEKSSKKKSNGLSSELLRKILVVLQFTLSVAMIIATLVVFMQMQYLRTRNLGFSSEHTLVLRYASQPQIIAQRNAIKQELEKHPGVLDVITSNDLPGYNHGRLTFYIDKDGAWEQEMVNYYRVDHDFEEMLDLKVTEGRFFSPEFPSDPNTSFVINEAARKVFGKNPIGKRVACGRGVDGKIVGVVENFNYKSLHQQVEPLVLLNKPEIMRFFAVKMDEGNMRSAMQHIKKVWTTFSTEYPYEYQFLDENFNEQYQQEQKMQTIFSYFALVTVFIASLGLFGLSSYMAVQRQKEMSIRKVLGSSATQVVKKFLGQFLIWVALGNMLAWPLAWWGLNTWLQNFAYHIELNVIPFVLAALLSLTVAIITVSFQALKTANSNPAEVLACE